MFVNLQIWITAHSGTAFSALAILFGAVLFIVSLRRDKKKQVWHNFHHHIPQTGDLGKSQWIETVSRALNDLFSSDKNQLQQKLLAAGFYHPKLAT